jgi:hypothetical protein
MGTHESQKAPSEMQKLADIAEWSSRAYKDLSDSMIRNAWRHGAYTFFPPTAEPRPANAATDNTD